MKVTRDSREAYLNAVRTAKKRVSQLPPEQLRDLVHDDPVKNAVHDLPVEVGVSRERHESSGGILVVAQAFRPWVRWLRRGGHMFVEGFILQPDGRITEPEPKDLWDYT